VGLLLKGTGLLETKDLEVLDDFCTLIFTGESSLQQSQNLRPEGKSGARKTHPQ